MNERQLDVQSPRRTGDNTGRHLARQDLLQYFSLRDKILFHTRKCIVCEFQFQELRRFNNGNSHLGEFEDEKGNELTGWRRLAGRFWKYFFNQPILAFAYLATLIGTVSFWLVSYDSQHKVNGDGARSLSPGVAFSSLSDSGLPQWRVKLDNETSGALVRQSDGSLKWVPDVQTEPKSASPKPENNPSSFPSQLKLSPDASPSPQQLVPKTLDLSDPENGEPVSAKPNP